MANRKQINLELHNPNNNKTGKWTIFYDSKKMTKEEILNYVEEQRRIYYYDFEKMLLNLMIVKGMICVPTESTELITG